MLAALVCGLLLHCCLAETDYLLSSSTSSSFLRVLPGDSVVLEFYIPNNVFSDPDQVRGLTWRTKGVFLPSELSLVTKIQPLVARHEEEGIRFIGTWYAPSRECKQLVELVVFDRSGPYLVNDQRLVFQRTILVTCSNGLYCDGQERFLNGKCVRGSNLCDDGESCTTDTCVEENGGHCVWTLDKSRPECKSCGEYKCVRNCAGRECGEDGCHGTCGLCTDGFVCSTGKCLKAESGSSDGTCRNPLPLIDNGAEFIGTHVVNGDTTHGINTFAPTCNTLSDAVELIYSFKVPTGSYQYVGAVITIIGNNYDYDTVLEVFEDTCGSSDHTIGCSDDGTPPGATGSRLELKLKPGSTYYILVDGYNAGYAGPVTIHAVFIADCTPQCDGNFCLDNGCGVPCGTGCPDTHFCSTKTAKCVVKNCKPDCDDKHCGSDGCESTCGDCADNAYCSFDIVEDEVINIGACTVPEIPCDGFNPVCPGGCGPDKYCGNDCNCYLPSETLADLVVEVSDLVMGWEELLTTSCSVVEGCSPNTGNRKLMRFTVRSVNVGWTDLIVPQPKELPQYYEFSPCHQHWHFRGYARYVLFDLNDRIIRDAGKQSYCLEDSGPVFEAPWIECSPFFECSYQGIQRGWTDEYANVLDCQWLDLTDIPDGIYRLEIVINHNSRIHEQSLENNFDYVYFNLKGDQFTVMDEKDVFPPAPPAPEPSTDNATSVSSLVCLLMSALVYAWI